MKPNLPARHGEGFLFVSVQPTVLKRTARDIVLKRPGPVLLSGSPTVSPCRFGRRRSLPSGGLRRGALLRRRWSLAREEVRHFRKRCVRCSCMAQPTFKARFIRGLAAEWPHQGESFYEISLSSRQLPQAILADSHNLILAVDHVSHSKVVLMRMPFSQVFPSQALGSVGISFPDAALAILAGLRHFVSQSQTAFRQRFQTSALDIFQQNRTRR